MTDDIELDLEQPAPPEGEKLQKVLARAGAGSRREMERAITDGRVGVNGVTARLGDRVGSDDKVTLDGKVIASKQIPDQALRVILYNKPEGQICSRSDPEGRPTVYNGLPRLHNGRWISVGRLDFNTSGLLLFTNDGELANRLMHPSTGIDREYLARIQGEVTDEMLQRMREGVLLEDGIARFTDIVEGKKEGSNRWFYCVVMEGRNREVRRLWESQEVRVSRLKRVRFGNMFIPSQVRAGQWIELTYKELSDLCTTAGLEPPAKQKFSPELQKARIRHQEKLRKPSSSRSRPKK
ncbi:23S rRNA pseudouridine(2605) synthase RluB [Teredinibacter waterburyi]|jgi:ribosomal large subunit pseudouridine synthase B (EC 5.4.99.-)|uniref:23S rRNA pseudouridine(2605) synthase RluB n=1 Tax=Teredinibacter waterburyi TaxID=1500538 RepID=UPI00165FC6FF|nr:pseudouridine synthase [Teredinibacter waterburyi]